MWHVETDQCQKETGKKMVKNNSNINGSSTHGKMNVPIDNTFMREFLVNTLTVFARIILFLGLF